MLETLLKFSNRQFTINELAKESKVPFASAWRLVQKWEPAGIIETGRIGKSVTVKLKKSEYLDSIVSLLKLSVSPQAFTVSALKDFLVKEDGIKEAYLFGSVARGEEKITSDIDLALLATSGYDANALVYDSYSKLGTKIVPITFISKKEFSAFLADKNGVRLK